MQCPDCSGPMWDNRENKRNPKSPDFKCKNKQCDKAVWEKPRAGGAQAQSGAKLNGSAGTTRAHRPLAPLYNNCLALAATIVKKHLPNASPADVLAGAATLFIAASRDGTPLTSPKPAPPPPPKPTEDYEEYPAALNESEDGLPF